MCQAIEEIKVAEKENETRTARNATSIGSLDPQVMLQNFGEYGKVPDIMRENDVTNRTTYRTSK